MSAAALQRLQADLQAGRGFERDAEAELVYQQALADVRWREPGDAFWAGLFDRPLELQQAAALQRLREVGYTETQLVARPSIGHESMSSWQSAIARGTIEADNVAGLFRVHLRAWGNQFNVAQRSGLPNDESWTQRPAAWRLLVLQSLPVPAAEAIFRQLGAALEQRLREEAGQLQLPALADLDEVLGLALLGLPKPGCRAWLAWLLQQGLWAALRPALADLQRRMEGKPLLVAWQAPDAVLQHLRRLLLLHLLDAGPAARAAVTTSGQLALLTGLPIEPGPTLPAALYATLASHWQQELQAAFQPQRGGTDGHDVRDRLLAGRMLGVLGDTLRLQSAQAATGTGLRLHPALWASVGRPGQPSSFMIGSAPGQAGSWAVERDAWPATVPQQRGAWLQAARLPVTCAEWRCFVEADGYNPDAEHWKAAGQQARAWLQKNPRRAPPALDDSDFGNGMNPITTISLYEAMAYAAWAAPMHAAANPDPARWTGPDLRPPSEAEWEAAQRAGADGLPSRAQQHWPGSGRLPQPMDFNHAATGWRQPSPVGAFPLSYSVAGLCDGAGNVWEWCINALPCGAQPYTVAGSRQQAQADWDPNDGTSARALRGGAFNYTADDCRPACRSHSTPGGDDDDVGVRFVRCWLPHSEH